MSAQKCAMKTLIALIGWVAVSVASAAPVVYDIDPNHTYPSFEADHMGISVWRGKFNKSAGKVTVDKTAGQATLEVTVDTASVDFGLEQMNKVAKSADLFDTAKYPQATYKGKLEGFADGAPTRVVGPRRCRERSAAASATHNGWPPSSSRRAARPSRPAAR